MRIIKVCALVLGVLVSHHAASYDYVESCHGCTDQQKKWQAQQAVPQRTTGSFEVYVVDGVLEMLTKFRVSTFYEPWDRIDFTAAVPEAVDPAAAADFAAALDLYKRVESALESSQQIPATLAGSAYDVVLNSNLQRQVALHIASNLSFAEIIGSAGSAVLIIFRKIIDVNPYIEVTFADGSTMRFELSSINASSPVFEFTAQPGTARDADGNLIPENSVAAQTFAGTFAGDEGARRMMDHLNFWFSGTLSGYTCTSTDNGHHIIVTCRRVTIIGR